MCSSDLFPSHDTEHEITYDCGAEHQVIMCVYHAVPMLDWELTGQAPQLTVTAISDFPQPAFDQLGMQSVPALNLQNNPGRNVSGALGYNLRYWQWKSNIDTVHAGFGAGAAYQSWAAPLDGWQVLTSSGAWSYQSMKVRPQQLNSIFFHRLMLPIVRLHLTNYCVMLISKYMLSKIWIEMVYLINCVFFYEKFCLQKS